jgi:hypothetical protein
MTNDKPMPNDPDWEDVPTPLLAANHKRVLITGLDSESEEPQREYGVLVVVPELFVDVDDPA